MNDQPLRLLLVDLPPGTSAQHIGFARPLGERAAVIARLVELLPGTTFNAAGRGSFKRATYEIAFTIVEPEPHSIEVEIDHHEGFVALKRLVAKTGWQMIDPVGETFVDLEASAAVGAIVPLMTSTADSAPSTADEGPGLRRWVGLATLVACVLGSIWFGWKWNHRTPTIQELLASRPVAGPGSGFAPPVASGTMPGMSGPPTGADLEKAKQDFLQSADQLRARMSRMKLIAPHFRFDPIVQQLYEYRQAAAVFPNTVGAEGYLPPQRLSDPLYIHDD